MPHFGSAVFALSSFTDEFGCKLPTCGSLDTTLYDGVLPPVWKKTITVPSHDRPKFKSHLTHASFKNTTNIANRVLTFTGRFHLWSRRIVPLARFAPKNSPFRYFRAVLVHPISFRSATEIWSQFLFWPTVDYFVPSNLTIGRIGSQVNWKISPTMTKMQPNNFRPPYVVVCWNQPITVTEGQGSPASSVVTSVFD